MSAQAVRLSNVDINNALENKDFEVLFQPIFDLSNGALARMETFVRWRHPALGVLPPGAFISFFESQGRMGELTRYILDTALERYSEWRGPFAPGFSVNLSLADLADDDFIAHLTAAIEAVEFPADLITLECPMPPVDSDIEDMVDRFARLRETGVRLAIEVRGRANDFLRTVDPFPFDEIKTGGASILRFARTVRGPGLSAISDLLDIAKKANAVTTAVGVEDQASLAALRDLGFTAAQGNHLSKVGDLSLFRPARVNTVRELLGLPTLNGDELAALFRTSAPSPMSAELEQTVGREPALETEMNAVEPPPEVDAETVPSAEDKEALVARARKKAKAIALAKRAKARDARKAAAIKRAKAKVALSKQETEDGAEIRADAQTGPRDLQNRIAEEFDHGQDPSEVETPDDAAPLATSEEPAPIMDEEPDVAAMTKETPPSSDHETDTPAQDPQGADATPSTLNLKMPVGQAGAYFHPNIAVASGAPTIHTDKLDVRRDEPSQPAAPTLRDDAFSAMDIDFVDDPLDEAEVAADAQDAEDVKAVADAPAPTMQDESVKDRASDAKTPHRSGERKRRKNFLQRRYKFPPSHFWPKPWKRSWRRLTSSHEDASAQA